MRLFIARMTAVAVLSVASGLLVGASLIVLTPIPAGRILIRAPIVLHPSSPTPTGPGRDGSPAQTVAVVDPALSARTRAPARATGPADRGPAPASAGTRASSTPAPVAPSGAPVRVVVNPLGPAAPAPAFVNRSAPPVVRPAGSPAPTPAVFPTSPARTEAARPADRDLAEMPQPAIITIAVGVAGGAGEMQISGKTASDRRERE